MNEIEKTRKELEKEALNKRAGGLWDWDSKLEGFNFGVQLAQKEDKKDFLDWLIKTFGYFDFLNKLGWINEKAYEKYIELKQQIEGEKA